MKIPKRKKANWQPKKRINVNDSLYQSSYWKNKVKSFWTKPENQICRMCNKPREKYFVVDHIKRIPFGVSLREFIDLTEAGELQALCRECHHIKTQQDRK